MMIDDTDFTGTELTIDDVVDFSLTGGNTKSTLRRVEGEDDSVEFYDGDILRKLITYADGEVTTMCFDDEGELHDYGSVPAMLVRNETTKEVVLSENYRHGEFVEKLMRVPLKSAFSDLE